MKSNEIIDNRFIVANLIACDKDEKRVVDPEMFDRVFEIQEKVIEDILQSFGQRQALERAPKSLDPIQQTIATTIQRYISHPDIDRKKAIAAIKFLNEPKLAVQIKKLRGIYKTFEHKGDAKELIEGVSQMIEQTGTTDRQEMPSNSSSDINLRREDLHLICFDFVS